MYVCHHVFSLYYMGTHMRGNICVFIAVNAFVWTRACETWVVNVEAESSTSKDVSWCQCIFVCECACERLYFLDKNTVLPLNKTLVSRPYGEKWTVIKEPETLTRHQGCRKNITWGLIKENLNNIICAAFINSLLLSFSCVYSLPHAHGFGFRTIPIFDTPNLFFVAFTWNQDLYKCLMGFSGFFQTTTIGLVWLFSV